MKRVLFVLAFGSMLAMADSWSGFISDSMCAAKHTGANGEKDAKCAQACVKEHGADPVFVSDGKVYKIADDSKSKVADHVGHKVTIDGTMNGDTITVNDVKM
ncbi:MAG TPA: hypothetical protein VFA04_06690 [Bryobacteraceae bacterium]|nr:hypothetical protein [Bryobacteraceae bacterium]